MGNAIMAEQTFQRGLEAVPDSGLLKMLLASFYEKSSKFDQAKAFYEQVLQDNPDHLAVINNLASLLTDQFESSENIKRAVALTERFADSEQPFFIDTYAWALVKSGLPQAAEPLLVKAVEIAPDVAVFHYHLGVSLKRLGRIDEAKKVLLVAQNKTSDKDPLKERIELELIGI
jgi:Flp pilus assembly protein TadD